MSQSSDVQKMSAKIRKVELDDGNNLEVVVEEEHDAHENADADEDAYEREDGHVDGQRTGMLERKGKDEAE